MDPVFLVEKSLEVSSVAEQATRSWTSDVGLLECHHQPLSMVLSSAACATTVTHTRPLMTHMIIPLQSTCPSHLLQVCRLFQRLIMPAVLEGTPTSEDAPMGEEVTKRRLTRRKSVAGGRDLAQKRSPPPSAGTPRS